MKNPFAVMCAAGLVLVLGSAAVATVDIVTVPVGNPGNAGELSGSGASGSGPDRICGAVNYEYNIGTYEVSNAEYAEFLNAVATVGDPHGLYNTNMGSGWDDIGGISRTGSGTGGEPWVYSTRTNRGNRPVNYVSFWDACRFANWLHNGQGSGDTETGAYALNGVTNPPSQSITRNPGWEWAVTSEDEWYKAAYHMNDGVTGSYYDCPTGSDSAPTSETPPGMDMTDGSANYYDYNGYVDPTYYTTECGAYDAKPSDSPYGTFDQGGNVWEWTEAIIEMTRRGLRGGSYGHGFDGFNLHAANRYYYGPESEDGSVGFRVSEVPEPCSLSLLALGAAVLLGRRRRRAAWMPVLAAVAALSWLSPLTACGATPSFQPLGYLVPEHDVSQASGVSDDGSTVVGTSRESVLEAFRWTEETGMLRLTGTQSWATATSADGSVVVGYQWSSSSSGQAFRWTEESGTVFLPGLPPAQLRSWAKGVSADGSVVVGHSNTGRDDRGWETHEAWRWTAETGTVGLGDLPGWRFDSTARGVSADGSIVVGQGCTGVPSDGSPAIRWTQETGMVSLGDLPGGRHTVDDVGRAFGVSADGLVVVGRGSADLGWEAFRWTAATGMVGLGEFPDGHFSSCARAASGDGSIVVGVGTTALGERAAIWDAAGTMRNLGDVLVSGYGLDLTGWTLSEATDITPDGQVIVGYGINPAGDTEAWRAVIPEPATLSLLGIGALALIRRRRGGARS